MGTEGMYAAILYTALTTSAARSEVAGVEPAVVEVASVFAASDFDHGVPVSSVEVGRSASSEHPNFGSPSI